jgi:hypothetical protein
MWLYNEPFDLLIYLTSYNCNTVVTQSVVGMVLALIRGATSYISSIFLPLSSTAKPPAPLLHTQTPHNLIILSTATTGSTIPSRPQTPFLNPVLIDPGWYATAMAASPLLALKEQIERLRETRHPGFGRPVRLPSAKLVTRGSQAGGRVEPDAVGKEIVWFWRSVL